GATLIVMFASSALHHVAYREDGALRKIDMTAIYLFIAGTYTPVCLLALPHSWGWSLLIIVWALAGGGIALRWALPKTPRWVTVGLYLGLGWIGVVTLVPLAQSVAWKGVALLVAGGIIYSMGAVVYARERPDPWPRVVGHHGLWHIFVLFGALSHFALVWLVSAA
ncbi:MAG: hemolysin III family protein, partial [Candidatus Thermoplasmatota archaeon]